MMFPVFDISILLPLRLGGLCHVHQEVLRGTLPGFVSCRRLFLSRTPSETKVGGPGGVGGELVSLDGFSSEE